MKKEKGKRGGGDADLISPWPKEVFLLHSVELQEDALDDMNEREGFGAYRKVQPSPAYLLLR